jgi:hypothetical protein
MKRVTLTVCASMLLFVACNNEKKDEKTSTDKNSTQTSAGKMDDTTTSQPIDSATMMKNWQAYMTPGEMHAMLAKSVGTWNGEITMWETPGAPSTTSNGTAVYKMVLGGRYLEGTHTGNMMGMPYEGHSLTGYDNGKKVFFNGWIDNMGTGIMHMEGSWDDASKTITFKGKEFNPMTMKDCEMREVFKIVDDNNQIMEMYGPGPDGKEFKMMEIKSTRKK